jgi:hypothetical protein
VCPTSASSVAQTSVVYFVASESQTEVLCHQIDLFDTVFVQRAETFEFVSPHFSQRFSDTKRSPRSSGRDGIDSNQTRRVCLQLPFSVITAGASPSFPT